MNKFLLVSIILFSAAVAAFVFLSFKSRSGKANGIVEGRLAACPSSPNCIVSEYPNDEAHFLAPLNYAEAGLFATEFSENLSHIQRVLDEMGGRLQLKGENYLWYTFTTPLMRYTDDFELRLDDEKQLVHFRSASRVGYGDLGANQKRVEQFKARLLNFSPPQE